ncbi:hypothetical protein K435DRAFT_810122, partial [Dendrothele bispora CBS 962.96]
PIGDRQDLETSGERRNVYQGWTPYIRFRWYGLRVTSKYIGMRACMPTPVSTFLHELSCLDVVVKRELDLNFIVLIGKFGNFLENEELQYDRKILIRTNEHRLPGIRKMLLRSCPYTVRSKIETRYTEFDRSSASGHDNFLSGRVRVSLWFDLNFL